MPARSSTIIIGVILVCALLAGKSPAEAEDAVPVLDTAGFWRVHYTLRLPVYLKDKPGRRRGRVSGARYPKSSWRALNIASSYLAPGPDGPVATARLEMVREGVQECEARIFIERALTDPDASGLRAKLGEHTAGRLQTMLDDRTHAVRQGVATFVQSGHYAQHHTRASSCWSHPRLIGGQWYLHARWQQRSKKLFHTAAQVARKLNAT